MKIPYKASGMALSFLLFLSASAQAGTVVYSTILSASAEADPTNASTGTGTATFTFDNSTNMLSLSVMFSGLTGLTTVSHIHAVTAAAFSGNAGVATQVPTFSGFPAGVMSGNYNSSFDLDEASSYNPSFLNNATNGGSTTVARNTLLSAMEGGNAYLNIHTDYKTAGEIRGYISRVPDSGSTLALMIPAVLMAIGLTYRQRRQS